MNAPGNPILPLFHHIHHTSNGHEVHHCGGEHRHIDPAVNYSIQHCACQKHRIDKQRALGHATGADTQPISFWINFIQPCPEGGWHIESGVTE